MDLMWGFYLGFDWPWLLFFVVLGLSVGLAVMAKKWQVIWVLPALVLYSGLLWVLPDGWSVLFKLVFWLAVIVAVVTALLPEPTRTARLPVFMMLGLVAWCLVIWCVDSFDSGWWGIVIVLAVVGAAFLLFKYWIAGGVMLLAAVVAASFLLMGFGSPKDEPIQVADDVTDACITLDGITDDEEQAEVPAGYEVDDAGNCAKTPPEPTPSTEPAVDPTACPVRYVQNLDPNEQFRFESDGFKGTASEKRQQLIKATAHDYRYLTFVGEQLFKRAIDEDKMVSADERCLSPSGRALHTQVMGALMASSVRTGQAPAGDYNTGMENGRPVVSSTRGIYGDRKATIYTLADGTKLIVLDRCGNITVSAPPKGTPPGETDNPPPKPPKTPDTPEDEGGCVEIPGNGVYDCGSKDPSQEPAQQGNVPDQVQGQAPGVNNQSASPPAANHGGGGSSGSGGSSDDGNSGGSGGGSNPPPPEPDTPTPDDPEPSPTIDPCQANPDFCE